MHVKNVDNEDATIGLDGSLSHIIADIEIMLMPNSAVERAVDGMSPITLHPTLVQPHGSGRVELASTDALKQPCITYPLLNNDHDIASARLAVRFTMRLADIFQHSGYPYPSKLVFAPAQDPTPLEDWEKSFPDDYLVPKEVPASSSDKQPKTSESVSDEGIDEYMRRVSHTSLHFAGTCPVSQRQEVRCR
jgi:choline dehydrogenase-like flavoprotein